MKRWIVLALLAALVAFGGALLASQQEGPEQETEEDIEEFVPTERVPAGGAISFPVDI